MKKKLNQKVIRINFFNKKNLRLKVKILKVSKLKLKLR